jgi:hypothetical protein
VALKDEDGQLGRLSQSRTSKRLDNDENSANLVKGKLTDISKENRMLARSIQV